MKPIAMIAFCAVAASSVAQAADPSLVGTWTGERQRIAKVEGLRGGLATLVITEQQGRTFTGHLKRANTDGDVEEGLWGAFTPDGRLIVGADEEGTYAFALIDANTLDYCYTEAGSSPRHPIQLYDMFIRYQASAPEAVPGLSARATR